MAFKNKLLKSAHWLKWGIKNIIRPKNQVYSESGKVVVIGNGPSAGDFPFEDFRSNGYEFCCVNFFVLQDKFTEVKPRYYCCIDPAFFDPAKNTQGNYALVPQKLAEVDWPLTIITFRGYGFPVDNPNITYRYLNNNLFDYEPDDKVFRLYAANKATCGFMNVVIAAIFYFVLCKVQQIVLTGVENNWHRELYVEKNNEVYRDDTHFYGKEKVNLTERGTIGKGELYKFFMYYYMTLYQYYLLSKFAEYNKVPVCNTCIESYIDTFTKVDKEELCG